MSKKEETVETPVEEPKEVLTDELKVGLERELRRYVKKSGGFRKGLPKEDEKKARKIMKRLGRKKLEWDLTILVPGFETYQT